MIWKLETFCGDRDSNEDKNSGRYFARCASVQTWDISEEEIFQEASKLCPERASPRQGGGADGGDRVLGAAHQVTGKYDLGADTFCIQSVFGLNNSKKNVLKEYWPGKRWIHI